MSVLDLNGRMCLFWNLNVFFPLLNLVLNLDVFVLNVLTLMTLAEALGGLSTYFSRYMVTICNRSSSPGSEKSTC